MTSWARIRVSDSKDRHVMPVNDALEQAEKLTDFYYGHVPSSSCHCKPRARLRRREGVLFVHHDPERGNHNA